MKITTKITSALVTTFFAMTTFANSLENTLHTQIIGRVVIEKNHTMTCMATNCPPSRPYFQLTLDDAQVEGLGPVETVIFQDFEKIMGVEQKPKSVTYGGVALREGMYIVVEADVRWSEAGEKIYVSATNPVEVKLVPTRYPVMLY